MRESRANVEAEKAGSARKLHRVPRTAEAKKRSRRLKFSRNSHKNAPPPVLRGDEEAWKIVLENMPLTGICAKSRGLYHGRTSFLAFEDLQSMVTISFFMDARHWDPEKSRLSTYLSSGVRRCIREIEKCKGHAYISPTFRKKAYAILSVMKTENCSATEAIERIGIPEKHRSCHYRMIECILAEKSSSGGDALFYSHSSAQFELKDGDSPRLFDVPSVDSGINTGPDQETPLNRKEMEDIVKKALAILRPTQKEVLERRFGFRGQEPQNLREIGEEFGISRERIRQIQNVALRRLRESKYAEALSDLIK